MNCTTPINDSCSLYYAPSSVPHAGYGVYTTRPISEFCPLFSGLDSPAIALTDHRDIMPTNLFMSYVWDIIDSNNLMESSDSSVSVVNVGSLANHNSYNPNIQAGDVFYNDTSADRFKDPGAGAYSYFYNAGFEAIVDIEAGEEFFISYGDDWMGSRGIKTVMENDDYEFSNDLFKTISQTIQYDMEGIDGGEDILLTVKKVMSLEYSIERLDFSGFPKESKLEKLSDFEPFVSDEVYAKIKEIVSDFNTVNEESCSVSSNSGADKGTSEFSVVNARLTAILRLIEMMESPLASIFPTTIEKWSNILQLYEKYNDYGKSLQFYQFPKKSIKWIKENGFCLDNIDGKESTIPQAGQGAFAKRFLSKGSMIIPAPLIQVMDRTDLFTYIHDVKFIDEDDIDLIPTDGPIGQQLLVNYCFSHKDTSLLLCPATSARLINHCGKKMIGVGTCDERGANAEIRWSESWDASTSEWLKLSISEITHKTEKKNRGLSIDIVATRDILPGEEIFIDYGSEWEDAWEDHVSNWQPPKEGSGFESYMPISNMNKEDFIPRTKEELEKEPYAQNVVTLCDYFEDESMYDDEYEYDFSFEEMEDLDSWSLEELIDEFTYDGSYFSYDLPYQLRRCEVISRFEETNTFLVRILGPSIPSRSKEFPYDSNIHEPIFLSDYPREGIVFASEIYKSDQHLPGAFRHYMVLRDNMVPDQWRNIRHRPT